MCRTLNRGTAEECHEAFASRGLQCLGKVVVSRLRPSRVGRCVSERTQERGQFLAARRDLLPPQGTRGKTTPSIVRALTMGARAGCRLVHGIYPSLDHDDSATHRIWATRIRIRRARTSKPQLGSHVLAP